MFRALKKRYATNKGYGIYILTLILSIIIFYIFNAISGSDMIQLLTLQTGDYVYYVALMENMMKALSIIVMIIFVVLISYASGFMFKKRSQELAMLILNGTSYTRLVMMLLKEHVVISIIVLSIGLTIGIGLSQFINLLVVSLFAAQANTLGFHLSMESLGYTLILYGMMMVLSLVIQYGMIKKLSLRSLLDHRIKTMRSHLHPFMAFGISIISLILLLLAYHLIFDIRFLSHDVSILLIPISLGIISTYTLFKGIPMVVLTVVKKIDKIRYGIYFYAIKSTLVNLSRGASMYALVCITLFLSLSVFGVAMGLKYTYGNTMEQVMPFDVTIKIYETDQGLIPVDTYLMQQGYDLDQLKEPITIPIYDSNGITYGYLLGDLMDQMQAAFPNFKMDQEVDLVTLDDYNTMLIRNGHDPITLPDGTYTVVYNTYSDTFFEQCLSWINKANVVLDIQGDQYSLQPVLFDYDKTGASINGTQLQIVIKSDASDLNAYASFMVADYSDGNNQDHQLQSLMNRYDGYSVVDCRLGTMNSASLLGIVMALIGSYLGVALTLTCGALIGLKELSDALETKPTYQHIYRIGYSKKMILHMGLVQSLVSFIAPALLAIIHTIVGLGFVSFISNGILVDSSIEVIGFTLMILAIYILYLIITLILKRNIILSSYDRNIA